MFKVKKLDKNKFIWQYFNAKGEVIEESAVFADQDECQQDMNERNAWLSERGAVFPSTESLVVDNSNVSEVFSGAKKKLKEQQEESPKEPAPVAKKKSKVAPKKKAKK